jgi:hypothetical protein
VYLSSSSSAPHFAQLLAGIAFALTSLIFKTNAVSALEPLALFKGTAYESFKMGLDHLGAGKLSQTLLCFSLAFFYPSPLIWLFVCLTFCYIRIQSQVECNDRSRRGLLASLGLGSNARNEAKAHTHAKIRDSFEARCIAAGIFFMIAQFIYRVFGFQFLDFWNLNLFLYAAPLLCFWVSIFSNEHDSISEQMQRA